MSRALHHHLHAGIPSAGRELPQLDELGDLRRVGGVVAAAGTHGIAQRDGHVVLVQDGQYLVVVLIEGVLAPRGLHPGEDEGAAAGDDVGQAARLLERLDDPAVHTRMDGDEIHAVFRMGPHHFQKVLGRDGDEGLFQIADGIVHGHRADHGRRLLDKLRAEGARLAGVRQIHDGIGPQFQGHGHLLPFRRLVGQVARDTEVHVHLGGQRHAVQGGAHAARCQARMVDVGGNGDAAGGHGSADGLGLAALGGGHGGHLGRDDAGTGIIHLGDRRGGRPRGGGRCGRRAVFDHKTPFVGITHSRFGGSRRMRRLLSACPAAHTAAASSPNMRLWSLL